MKIAEYIKKVDEVIGKNPSSQMKSMGTILKILANHTVRLEKLEKDISEEK